MTTRLPSIPLVPAGVYKQVCDALKEIVEVRNDRRGDPLDRFVALRELYDLISTDARLIALISSMVAAQTGNALDAPEGITIVGGVATATGNSHHLVLDTEGGAATDDLDRIDGFSERDIVLVRSASSSRVINVKRGDYFKMKADFSLNSIFDRIEFDCIGGDIMVQRWRSDNA